MVRGTVLFLDTNDISTAAYDFADSIVLAFDKNNSVQVYYSLYLCAKLSKYMIIFIYEIRIINTLYIRLSNVHKI